MSKSQPTRGSGFSRTVRKFFVSAFVIFTFIAYALHERLVTPDGAAGSVAPPSPMTTEQVLSDPASAATTAPTVFARPVTNAPAVTKNIAQPTKKANPTTVPPTRTTVPPSPTAVVNGMYKDGQYTGDTVDAYYGLVQVKAIIKNGEIADVQFLQYPNDRRTSQRINSQAMPWLQQEVIQAQSANVDIISGATLTSEAFVQSLEMALTTAKN